MKGTQTAMHDFQSGTMPSREAAWHACSDEEIYRRLRTNTQGLNQAEVDERLREYGKNILPGKKEPGLLQVVLHQFKSPLIYILLIAGVVSLLMGDFKDSLSCLN